MNDTIRNQIETLDTLRLPDLQTRYAEVLGEETRCPNKRFLIRRITETLEASGSEAPAPDANHADPIEDAPGEAVFETAPADSAPTAGPASANQEEAAGDDDGASENAANAGDEGNATRLSMLSVPELQALYLEVVGRATGSSAKRYLVWKIRQAQRGRIPVGPRGNTRRDGPAPDFKVLPLRMEAALVTQLDEARERLGLKSRMDLFRRSLHAYLLDAGEVRVAELFAAEA